MGSVIIELMPDDGGRMSILNEGRNGSGRQEVSVREGHHAKLAFTVWGVWKKRKKTWGVVRGSQQKMDKQGVQANPHAAQCWGMPGEVSR